MVEIRRTIEADADALRSIRLAALRSDPTAFGQTYDVAAADGPEVWRERAIGSDRNVTFVAVDENGAFVGLVGGLELAESSGQVELVSMWSDPRARRVGVGRSLVEAVMQWADARGTPEIRLWVTRGNDTAVRLYERCGFVLIDEIGVSTSDPCREERRMSRSGNLS